MKAAVYHGGGEPLAIETLEDPKPGPGDVIIKVHRCGVCGSDLHMTEGGLFDFVPGTVPGHEFAGEIVEVGPQVAGFKKGDLITALPSEGCGHCVACKHDNPILCHNAASVMGGFGDYMRVPTSVALKLPPTFSLADGALVEPFAVGLFGVRQAAITPGDRVLVLGAGTVALSTIFWASRLGAGRIVAVSRSDRRANMVAAMGADAFVQAGENEKQKIIEALGGEPDIVFECIGAPGMLIRSIDHVRSFGKVVSLGFCTSPDSLLPAVTAFKAPELRFPVGYSLKDFQYVADKMLAGDVDPKMLITSVAKLDDLPKVMEMLRGPNTETKVQISCDA